VSPVRSLSWRALPLLYQTVLAGTTLLRVSPDSTRELAVEGCAKKSQSLWVGTGLDLAHRSPPHVTRNATLLLRNFAGYRQFPDLQIEDETA
jgi:hypothetical protein